MTEITGLKATGLKCERCGGQVMKKDYVLTMANMAKFDVSTLVCENSDDHIGTFDLDWYEEKLRLKEILEVGIEKSYA